MIKKFVSLLALAIGISMSQVMGQAQVDVSEPYEVVDGSTKLYFAKDNQMLKVTQKGKLITIQIFDTKTLKELTRNEFEDLPKGFDLEEVVPFNNSYYFFYSVWDRKNELEQLFAREIDFKTGKLLPKEYAICKVEGKVTGASAAFGFGLMMGFGTKDKFDISTNVTGESLLVKYRKKPLEKKDSKNFDVIGFYVFNKDISKPLWSKEMTMPYTEALMDNLDYTVDRYGNAYMLAAVFEKEAKSRDDVDFRLELFQINGSTSKMSGVKVDFGGKSVNKIWIYESPKDYMVCAGFYSEDKKYSADAKGIFAFKVDKSGKIYDKNTYDIPLEIINQYASKRQIKKNEKKDDKGELEFSDLILRSILFQEDGSLLLVGEQHFIDYYTNSIPFFPYYTLPSGVRIYNKYIFGSNTSYYISRYNDILLTKITPDGKLAWMKKLAKRQEGGFMRGGLGFFNTSNDGKHYFLYMDNVKNMDVSTDEVPAVHMDGRGGYLTSYVVDDKTGNFNKASLFNSKDVEGQKIYQFNVDRIQMISGNQFVVESYKKGKEDILIRVKLK